MVRLTIRVDTLQANFTFVFDIFTINIRKTSVNFVLLL